MSESLFDQAFKGSIWLFASSTLKKVFKFLVVMILARLITPEEFGLVGLANIVIGFSRIFINIGIGPSLVQKEELLEEHKSSAFYFSLFFSIIILLIVFSSASLIANIFAEPRIEIIIQILSLSFLFRGLAVVPGSLMRRHLEFEKNAKRDFISYGIGYCLVGVLTALLGFGVWALVMASLVKTFMKTILAYYYFPFSPGFSFNINKLKSLLFYGGGITLGKVTEYFASRGDYILVGRLLGTYSLGLYERSYQLMVSANESINQILNRVLFPSYSKLNRSSKDLKEVLLKSFSLISYIFLPLTIFCFIFAREIILVVLGQDWLEAIPIFRILSLAIFLRGIFKVNYTFAKAIGMVYQKALRQGIYAGLIILFVFVGHYWGVTGVALGAMGALTCNTLLMINLSMASVKVNIFELKSPFLKPFLFSGFYGLYLGGLSYYIRPLLLNSLLIIFGVLMLSILYLVIILKFFKKAFINRHMNWLIIRVKTFILEKLDSKFVEKSIGFLDI